MAYDNATESPATGSPDAAPDKGAKRWLDLIDEAKRCFNTYQDKCDSIDKLYADLEAKSNPNADREFAIFWANLEVLKPTIYSRPPVPVVVPRFKDRKELPRKASEVLERCLISSFEADDIDETMRMVRDDLAINSRGVIWCRYEASSGEDGSVTQKVAKEHVDRGDFLHDPARKWNEVEWVARRSWLSRKKALARFGDIALKAEYSDKKTDKDEEYKGQKKCQVWELWHKTENMVVWVSPGMEDVLDIQPPFLSLEGFFPCPRPAYGTLKRRTMIPVPDLFFYKDQVEEINELTARISSLSESLRLKGFYPAGASDVADAIEAVLKDQSNTATLIPIASLEMFGQGGGSLKDSVIWLPVKDVANVITALVALRKQLIEDVYQITGLSDIMRGESDAGETATAQRIKSQYGSIRIRDRQNELVRIARDVTRIEAEIMAENFTPETLATMSQVDDIPTEQQIEQQIAQLAAQLEQAASDPRIQQMTATPEGQQQAQQALQAANAQIEQLRASITLEKIVELLRSQRVRPFVLEIETDSTIQPDEDAQKQRASEFVTAVGGYMQQAVAAVQMVPQMAPLAAEILQFVASQFRAGRSLDGAIDEFADQMKQLASQPKPPPPEQVKAEAETKKIEADAQARKDEAALEQQRSQNAAQADERKHAHDERMAQLDEKLKLVDLAIARVKLAQSAATKTGEGEEGGSELDVDALNTMLQGDTPKMMNTLQEGQAAIAQALAEMTRNLAAPVELVRGPDGKAVGTRRVMN